MVWVFGYGGVIIGFYGGVEIEFKSLFGILEDVFIVCILMFGKF